jgi:hypothetical protein
LKSPADQEFDFGSRVQRPETLSDSLAIHNAIAEIEQRFNNTQTVYRRLASTWLLASFAAMGFVLTTPVDWLIDARAVIALVGLAACVGASMLWTMDMLVYHNLLHAAFSCGRDLERLDPRLPPMRLRMIESQPGGSVRRRVVWYYVFVGGSGLTAATAAMLWWSAEVDLAAEGSFPWRSLLVACLGIASVYCYQYWMRRTTEASFARHHHASARKQA